MKRVHNAFDVNIQNPAFAAEYRRWIIPILNKYSAEVRAAIDIGYAANINKMSWFALFQDIAKSNTKLRAELEKVPQSVLKRGFIRLEQTVEKNIKTGIVKLSQKKHKYKKANGKPATVVIPAISLTPTRAERAFMAAAVQENASLIKSIGEDAISRATHAISNAVQSGASRAELFEELSNGFGISKRRAANIAIDQTNKITEQLAAFKMQSVGVTRGVWQHSHGDKKPRETHLAFDGKEYDLKKGLYDSQVKKYVKPGELINCTCTFRAVIPEEWLQ